MLMEIKPDTILSNILPHLKNQVSNRNPIGDLESKRTIFVN
jgi:hypothetical protein